MTTTAKTTAAPTILALDLGKYKSEVSRACPIGAREQPPVFAGDSGRALVKRLVEMHGGTGTAENPGPGGRLQRPPRQAGEPAGLEETLAESEPLVVRPTFRYHSCALRSAPP
jgi:hypothetical protein